MKRPCLHSNGSFIMCFEHRQLKSLSLDEKRIIGEDIKTLPFGWHLGIPVVRKMDPNLWGGSVHVSWPDRLYSFHGE